MKRTAVIISLIVGLFGPVFGQQSKLQQANDFYIQGKYEQAAQVYEDILISQGVAPQLYYNLGNAYFKQNETAKSILNYERALRLDPGFEDARFNLEVAQQRVVDNISQVPVFFVGRWIQLLMKSYTSNQWMYFSVILFVLALALAILFVFGHTLLWRKVAFYLGVSAFVLSGISLFFSAIRQTQLQNHHEAIVMTGIVNVKSAPDKSGTDLFQLHEGTKVTVRSSLGEWVEIELQNGNVGWAESKDLEKI